jgi:hypothetical protein
MPGFASWAGQGTVLQMIQDAVDYALYWVGVMPVDS